MWFISIGFIAAIIGLWVLNDKGSYATAAKDKWVSLLLSLVSVWCFVFEYGLARGIFVYLGVAALVGMVLTLLQVKKFSRS